MRKQEFKRHMLLRADEDSFLTLCGIDEGCSEAFYDSADTTVCFGNEAGTTCKRCLAKFKKLLAAEEQRVVELKAHEYEQAEA